LLLKAPEASLVGLSIDQRRKHTLYRYKSNFLFVKKWYLGGGLSLNLIREADHVLI
jgi:hypothetical protein